MKLSRATQASLLIALLFVGAAMAVFLAHIYSVKTNPADSGESAIGFVLFGLPWLLYLPIAGHGPWITYASAWLCILVNALLLFGITRLGSLCAIHLFAWFCQGTSKRPQRG